MNPRSGGCLCGATRFKATPASTDMTACHCGMCRRWAGGVWFTIACTDLTLDEGAAAATTASSEWAERGFCAKCGATLFWRMRDGSLITVSAYAFDDQPGFVFNEEIFIEEKPAHYTFADATKKMTGAEVIASFSQSQP